MTSTAEFSKYCINIFHVVKFILKSVKFCEQDTHENNARCTTKWKQKQFTKKFNTGIFGPFSRIFDPTRLTPYFRPAPHYPSFSADNVGRHFGDRHQPTPAKKYMAWLLGRLSANNPCHTFGWVNRHCRRRVGTRTTRHALTKNLDQTPPDLRVDSTRGLPWVRGPHFQVHWHGF